MNEFAEAYKITGNAKIYGTYIVNPAISKMSDLEVEITVYNGSDKPETLLHSESFSPSFVTLNDKSAFYRFYQADEPRPGIIYNLQRANRCVR